MGVAVRTVEEEGRECLEGERLGCVDGEEGEVGHGYWGAEFA